MMATISTLGAVAGLVIAIVLIILKVPPVYGMMLGALAGGMIGGAGLTETVSLMVSGGSGMASGILRIIAAGMLAGFLIESGSAETIAHTIVKKMGSRFALLAIILSAWVLQAVGTFGDVVVVIVAPIALDIALSTRYSKAAASIALIGGIHAGNIISPNPNTIALAENLGIPMTSVVLGGMIPALAGIAFTYIFMVMLKNKGEMVDSTKLTNRTVAETRQLPSIGCALAGPFCTIILLMLRPICGITIDPIVALPIGGVIGAIAIRQPKEMLKYANTGLQRMSGIVLLLLGTGTISGIISNSGLKDTLISLVEVSGLPGYILAPLSGIVMGGATASCVAGATVASQVFGPTILSFGVTAVQAAVMIHAGCCVFDCLPHGSFFHISAGTLQMSIKERLKIIPYESLIGFSMTAVATIVYGVLGFTF
ncbi:GntP family permease [Enterocloster citroniae]|uniref:GntP family permease n=3 Tax=Bacillota TaxID=1239 RepID=A0AA41FII9_9FIRM|nr:GntP family permease [Enterocloster citroniae]RGC12150.1 GntP family permease [Enterocloster citroniae]